MTKMGFFPHSCRFALVRQSRGDGGLIRGKMSPLSLQAHVWRPIGMGGMFG